MKNKNWFWGVFFLLSAVFVVGSQIGGFVEINVFSIVATVLFAALIIHSLISLNFFGVFVPIAFLYWIYQEALKLPEVSLWILIVAGVLTSIGCHILFRSRPSKVVIPAHVHGHGHDNFNHTTETMDDNHPYAKVSFGASSKYLHADCLQSGQFIVSFGALEVYFDQAQLSPEGAEVFLDCSFGAIELFVPRHWRVQDNLHASLGGVDHNKRSAQPSENAPLLILTGNVQLGGVEIKYI